MFLAATTLFAASACASARGGDLGNPDVISRAEIERYMEGGTSDLYELIQRARPRWLESRGDRSLRLDTRILVYQNQQQLGEPEVLRSLRPDNIMRIRRLDSSRAGLLPGGSDQHVESAIVLETMAARD
jgi:hypothetical protein